MGAGTDPITARPIFAIWRHRSTKSIYVVVGIGSFGGLAPTKGRRLPWFWGGNTSIPCRGFGPLFGIFVILANLPK